MPLAAQIPDDFVNLQFLSRDISSDDLLVVMRDFSFALDQLRRGRGTQFHPDCVDALVEILRDKEMLPIQQAAVS